MTLALITIAQFATSYFISSEWLLSRKGGKYLGSNLSFVCNATIAVHVLDQRVEMKSDAERRRLTWV